MIGWIIAIGFIPAYYGARALGIWAAGRFFNFGNDESGE